MEHRYVDGSGELNDENSSTRSTSPSSSLGQSPTMDRNPSPPPERDGEQAEDKNEVDAIGETVYSKHWLFSTLTRLIQMVTDYSQEDSESQMQLTREDEDDLCKIWDMAMDKDVAGFLQDFKAADILLGVIAKSQCPRLTEICVGILGNIACFPDTCLTLSQNKDLGAVLLLLLGDTDPPTLLETSRLLLTCVSQRDVSGLWLERIRQNTSVPSSLCFIMSSSTNMDLLVKVGELVDKLFDLDEELMKSWISPQPAEEDGETRPDLASSLLEAAKQLRLESSEGLEAYLHTLQLLTTVDEGIRALAVPDGVGQAVWDFLCEVVCEDLCQPGDPPLVLQEQNLLLVQALAVLSALYACPDHNHHKADTYLPLIGSMLRVVQYHREYQQSKAEDRACSGDPQKGKGQDDQLQALMETTTEFLADMVPHLSKDMVADLLGRGYLTDRSCLSATDSLLPQYTPAVQHLVSMLSETNPQMADMVKKQFPVVEVPR
ncbi:protein saal1 [Osmerus mordax]|uniref:protein saal1 n=1 Tax=Osmerus mordax TaxID=8014 RepID=UPI00350ED66D